MTYPPRNCSAQSWSLSQEVSIQSRSAVSLGNELRTHRPRFGLDYYISMNSRIAVFVNIHLSGSDRDASLRCIIKEIVTASKTLEELRIAPGRDDLDRRLDGVEGQFEPHLIISLACCAVADILTIFSLSSTDLSPRDNRTSQTCSYIMSTGPVQR